MSEEKRAREFWIADVKIEQQFGDIKQNVCIAIEYLDNIHTEISGHYIKVVERKLYEQAQAEIEKLKKQIEVLEQVARHG